MHKYLNKLGLAVTAAALSMTPAMASAQQTAEPPTSPDMALQHSSPMTQTMPDQHKALSDAEQQSLMEAWPAEKQASFKQWPAETQEYFWSLTPERKNLFWALADSDKVKLSNMPEQQRESVWAQIEAQLDPSRS